MEYEEEEYDAAGSVPEFGAIFMASSTTKRECFERSVFALPAYKVKFVKQVKVGMPLFLFEFEKRQLFGVFQASSDGALDIVPDGFHYSGGRHFPAQISFNQIWACTPLSEREFRDAIRENYYTPKKFRLGLSEDQVCKLLALFSSRRVQSESPHSRRRVLPAEATNEEECSKSRRLATGESFGLSKRTDNEYGDSDYRWKRSTENETSVKDVVKSHGCLINYDYDDSWKRRRVDYDEAENEIYGRCSPLSRYVDYPVHSPDERKRSVDRVFYEDQVDRKLSPVHRGYLIKPMETTDFDRSQRDRRLSTYNVDNVRHNPNVGPVTKHRHVMDDDNFSFRDCLQREDCNVFDRSFSRERDPIEDHRYFTKGKMENKYHVITDSLPVSSAHQVDTFLHNIRNTTTRDLVRIEAGHTPSTSMAEFTPESFSQPLDLCHSPHHYRNFPNVEIREGENVRSDIQRPTALLKESGYILVDDEIYGNASRHNMSSSHDRSLRETGFSRSFAARDGSSPSMFDDAIRTRPVAYVPETPRVSSGFPISSVGEWTSSQGHESYPHYSSRIYSLSNDHGSRPLGAPETINRSSPMNSLSHQSSMPHETKSYFSHSEIMHTARNASAFVNSRDSVIPNLPSPLPYRIHENREDEEWLFGYPPKTSRNCFASDGHPPRMGPRDMIEPYVPRMITDMSGGSDLIWSEANDSAEGVCISGGDRLNYDDYDFRRPRYIDLQENHEVSEAPQPDPNRTSVFKRLRSVPDTKGSEAKQDSRVNNYEDASAAEVMDMLREGKNPPPRNLGKSIAVGVKHDKQALAKKQIQSCNDSSRSISEVNKLKDDYLDVADITDEVPKETRLLDFKRRSQTQRKMVGSIGCTVANTNIVPIREVESPTKKTLKRRRLVRPNFGKIECLGSNQNEQHSDEIHNNDGKHNCEKAIEICKNENASSSNIFVTKGPQFICGDEHDSTGDQKDRTAAHMLQSSIHDPEKEHNPVSNVRIQYEELQGFIDQHEKRAIKAVADTDSIISREVESPRKKIQKRTRFLRPVFGKDEVDDEELGSNQSLKHSDQNNNSDSKENIEKAMSCRDVISKNTRDGHSNSDEQKAHMLLSSNDDLEKKHQVSKLSFQSDEVQVAIVQHKISASEVSKQIASILNHNESASEGQKLHATSGDPREGERSVKLKERQNLGTSVNSSNLEGNSLQELKFDLVSDNPQEGEELKVMGRIDSVGCQSGHSQLFPTAERKNHVIVASERVDLKA